MTVAELAEKLRHVPQELDVEFATENKTDFTWYQGEAEVEFVREEPANYVRTAHVAIYLPPQS